MFSLRYGLVTKFARESLDRDRSLPDERVLYFEMFASAAFSDAPELFPDLFFSKKNMSNEGILELS